MSGSCEASAVAEQHVAVEAGKQGFAATGRTAHAVLPGQRRRWGKSAVEVEVLCVDEPSGMVFGSSVVDGSAMSGTWPIASVAGWPLVQPLPELPEPRYSLISTDGTVSNAYETDPYAVPDALLRLVRNSNISFGARSDLFVRWLPQFVDRNYDVRLDAAGEALSPGAKVDMP
jgi:hypothetical protein